MIITYFDSSLQAISNNAMKLGCCRSLVRRGVNHSQADDTGKDAFMWAVYLGRLYETHYLLNMTLGDLDLLRHDTEGATVLHYISLNGYVAILQVLLPYILKYKLDVDTKDGEGMTPYIYAKKLGYKDIADMLLEAGASPNQADDVLHMRADEWASIGLKQRMEKFRRRYRHSSQALVQKVVPAIVVTDPHRVSMKIDLQGPLPSPGHVLRDWEDKIARRRTQGQPPMLSRSWYSRPHQRELHSWDSLPELRFDTAKSPNSESLEPDFPEHLSHSLNSLPLEVQRTCHLAKLMEDLAIQHSPSYRQPARPPKPPTPVLPDIDPTLISANDKKKKKKRMTKSPQTDETVSDKENKSGSSAGSMKPKVKKPVAKQKSKKNVKAPK